MSITYVLIALFGFIFGLVAYTQVNALKKRVSTLEALVERTDPRQ